ncbi:MAG: DUF3039 domain-containing protein [Actinomycetota bacterium]
MSSVDIEQRPRVAEPDDGDHERFSHYVPRSSIVESAVTGKAVTALCGKRWVPSRDPERFPICPECKRIKAERGG